MDPLVAKVIATAKNGESAPAGSPASSSPTPTSSPATPRRIRRQRATSGNADHSLVSPELQELLIEEQATRARNGGYSVEDVFDYDRHRQERWGDERTPRENTYAEDMKGTDPITGLAAEVDFDRDDAEDIRSHNEDLADQRLVRAQEIATALGIRVRDGRIEAEPE